jgi:hypothetical protein
LAPRNAKRCNGCPALGATALASGLASVALAHAQVPPATPTPAPDIVTRAQYLAKLPPFVQWPPSAFDSPTGPLNICLVGADPFGGALDRMVLGQHVDQHPIEVKRLAKVDKSAACHVLYLGALKGAAGAEALQAVRDAPVLTVTEAERDDPKGVVDFHVEGVQVRLEVDQDAARRGGLVVSSKLLSLAALNKRREQGAAN